MNYEELVKSLRICAKWPDTEVKFSGDSACNGCKYHDAEKEICLSWLPEKKNEKLLVEAADAIEELLQKTQQLEERTLPESPFEDFFRYYAEKYGPVVANATEELVGKIDKLQKTQQLEWIPFKTRPMDEEERKEWSERLGYALEKDEAVIYTGQLPDDGQEVLVYGSWGRIWIDKFSDDPDYGCSFEENGDIDGLVAWMPLPPPPKEETE